MSGKVNPVCVHLVAAARPNFMKVAPLYHALKREGWCRSVLVHTGQHYDAEMSEAFLRDLELPNPDLHLGVGSGSHAEQTAGVMVAYEKVCVEARPDWIIVVGDVNSTMACTQAAKKLCLPVAYLEAGLRSGDLSMPEEINRIVTDAVADLLWTPSPDADENLRHEGIPTERISRVGNIMMDSYELLCDKIEKERAWTDFSLEREQYGVVTLHRPSNVDDATTLHTVIEALVSVSRRVPLVFPVHPRTRQRLQSFGLWDRLLTTLGVKLVEPISYIRFMSLIKSARFAITDSGGIQEETTYLHIPCLTLRPTTERPITVTQGTNRLVTLHDLEQCVDQVLRNEWPQGVRPELWDGKTAHRVVASLREFVSLHHRAHR